MWHRVLCRQQLFPGLDCQPQRGVQTQFTAAASSHFFCPSSATARHHCTGAAYVCCQLRDNSAAASFLRSFNTVSPQREAALSIFSFCTLPQQCYSSSTLHGSCAAVTSSYPHHHVTIRIVGNISPSISLPSATTAVCSSA